MFVLLFLLLLPILSCSKNVSFYVYLRGLAILSHGVWKIELTNSSQNTKNNWSIHRPTPFRRIKITIWNQLHVENYQFVKMPNCRKKRLGQFLLSHARKACEGLQKNTTHWHVTKCAEERSDSEPPFCVRRLKLQKAIQQKCYEDSSSQIFHQFLIIFSNSPFVPKSNLIGRKKGIWAIDI